MAASVLTITDDFVHGPLRAVFVFLGLPAALLGVNYLGDGWLFAIDGIET